MTESRLCPLKGRNVGLTPRPQQHDLIGRQRLREPQLTHRAPAILESSSSVSPVSRLLRMLTSGQIGAQLEMWTPVILMIVKDFCRSTTTILDDHGRQHPRAPMSTHEHLPRHRRPPSPPHQPHRAHTPPRHSSQTE